MRQILEHCAVSFRDRRLAVRSLATLVLALLPLLPPARLHSEEPGPVARISRRGAYEGGRYRIEVPARWNGGLVMYAHGFGAYEDSPLACYLADQGYAWAGSSYRSTDYRVEWFIDDTLKLRELFIREIGRPRWTIIHGRSMGGHVAISSLELHPGMYQGALIECGVIDGVRSVDLIYAYRAAAEFFSGATILDVPDPLDYARRVNELVLPALGMPGAYTEAGRRFDSVVKCLFGGDLPLRLQGLRLRYVANMFVPVPRAEPLGRSASTLGIRYRIDPGLGITEDELNARIRRIAPAPGARSRDVDPVYAELTGRITVPVLAVHETGDARVPFSVEQSYRRRTIAAGTSHLLVQRAVRWPSHCGAPEDVRERALEDLVSWIERGVMPAGDDVLSADLSALGLRWTSIRHPEDPVRSR
ncbi:MAG: hypothetical protein HY002_19605 [Candidatus Rokubacteria bacterium]|nr:hypothetical protein [Candidatus Rokubacteria bacterium]